MPVPRRGAHTRDGRGAGLPRPNGAQRSRGRGWAHLSIQSRRRRCGAPPVWGGVYALGALPVPHHDVRCCPYAPPGAFLPFGRSELGAPRSLSTRPAAAFPCLFSLNLPLPAPPQDLGARQVTAFCGLRSRSELGGIVRVIPHVTQPPALPRNRRRRFGPGAASLSTVTPSPR